MVVANEEGLRIAEKYKTELLKKLFPKSALQEITAQALGKEDSIRLSDLPPSNIIGVGYGSKEANGKSHREIAVRVYVREKLLNSQVSLKGKIPSEINGIPTDVIPVGDICAQCAGGDSVQHYRGTPGTLGFFVVRSADQAQNEYYILSNNHVLANCNEAQFQDHIILVGLGDVNRIAVLADYEKLHFQRRLFGQSEFLGFKLPGNDKYNTMDAAIAKVSNCNQVSLQITDIGRVETPATDACIGQRVCKYGSTTKYRVGTVADISADINNVSYKNKTRYANFQNQIGIKWASIEHEEAFSLRGDSGSLVVHAETKQPVALLFAGGNGITYATPIGRIINRFNIDFPVS